MSFTSRLKERTLESIGLFLDRPAAGASVNAFLGDFRSMLVPVELIRVGGASDGGYLIPDDLDGVRNCFSPGVDVKATFESELAQTRGIRSFMADASVSKPPLANELFDFEALYLGSCNDESTMTLSSWVERKVGDDDCEMILQMDIEGAEYEVFIETPMETLKRFRMMILEFHDLERLFDQKMLPVISAVFAKLSREFSIAHVHLNNCRSVVKRGSVSVPRVIEVSFIRKDRIQSVASNQPFSLPHRLDEMCCPRRPDMVMPDAWWKPS